MPGVDVVPPKTDLKTGEEEVVGGRRTRGATAKQLKRMLKKAGLKTTGKKAALTRRAKKAHLKLRGGEDGAMKVMQGGAPLISAMPLTGARRSRRSRKSRGFKLF